MRISDWSSDVCSSDLPLGLAAFHARKTAMQAFSNHRTSCISPASQDRSDREWKSMEPIIELYHNDLSSCAQKVRIALYEMQLPWKSHHLNPRKGDQFKPEYMKLNPNGVVPTLVHGDRKRLVEGK